MIQFTNVSTTENKYFLEDSVKFILHTDIDEKDQYLKRAWIDVEKENGTIDHKVFEIN